jgi:hypothetical protein
MRSEKARAFCFHVFLDGMAATHSPLDRIRVQVLHGDEAYAVCC